MLSFQYYMHLIVGGPILLWGAHNTPSYPLSLICHGLGSYVCDTPWVVSAITSWTKIMDKYYLEGIVESKQFLRTRPVFIRILNTARMNSTNNIMWILLLIWAPSRTVAHTLVILYSTPSLCVRVLSTRNWDWDFRWTIPLNQSVSGFVYSINEGNKDFPNTWLLHPTINF